MAKKATAVKLDNELYEKIVKIISNRDFKYRYATISSLVNEAVHEKIKQIKKKGAS